MSRVRSPVEFKNEASEKCLLTSLVTILQASGVKIRSSEKDQLIAELRQRLYDLRNQDRDYRGVNDEIFAMENRLRMLQDDKARAVHEGNNSLNASADQISDARRQLEDLKFLLSDK